jgi:hypothetical protein
LRVWNRKLEIGARCSLAFVVLANTALWGYAQDLELKAVQDAAREADREE